MDNQVRARGLLPVLLALTVLAGGCGAAHSGASAGATTARAMKTTCQQISDVLSNGPDPGADPAGYAEAQVLPLRQIRSRDAALAAAIRTLDGAYRSLSASGGTGRAAKNAITAASGKVNSFCPGAAS